MPANDSRLLRSLARAFQEEKAFLRPPKSNSTSMPSCSDGDDVDDDGGG